MAAAVPSLMKARILIMRSRTDGKLPRWMAWRSMMENQTFNQIQPGSGGRGKWTWILGLPASQALTFGCLWAA